MPGPADLKQLRYQVLNLYKTLLYYGRDYPLGYTYFRNRCHRSFEKHADEKDPQQIAKLIQRGEFIIKELEALYRLKKYRYLKEKYYPDTANAEEFGDPQNMMRKLKDLDRKDGLPNPPASASSESGSNVSSGGQ